MKRVGSYTLFKTCSYLTINFYDIGAPGSVAGLSAVPPDGSITTLTVTWSAPAQPSGTVSQYFVIVTNYSLALVTNKTVSGITTSTNVTGLGKFLGRKAMV